MQGFARSSYFVNFIDDVIFKTFQHCVERTFLALSNIVIMISIAHPFHGRVDRVRYKKGKWLMMRKKRKANYTLLVIGFA